jgi:hypothetical protein
MSDSTEEGVSDVLYRIQLVYDQKMKIQTASDPSGMPRIKCPTCTMTVCNTDCKARSMVLAMNTDFKWLQSDLQAYTQGKDTKISQEKKELGLRAFQNKYKELLADSADMVTVFKQDGTFAAMEMKKNDLFAIMNEFIDNCSQFEIAGTVKQCSVCSSEKCSLYIYIYKISLSYYTLTCTSFVHRRACGVQIDTLHMGHPEARRASAAQ